MRRSNAPTFKRAQQLARSSNNDATSTINQPTAIRPTAVRPTSNLQSTANKTRSSTDDYQVFTVVFGDYKPGKKHKEWKDDAILERDCQSIKIYNLEGERTATTFYDKQRPLKPDDILRIGKHEYMIIDPVTIDAFKRGECFTQAYKPKKDDEEDDKINESPVQSNSLKRKLSDTVRTPFVCPFKLPKTDDDAEKTIESEANAKQPLNRSLNSSAKENRLTKLPSQFQAFGVLVGDYKPGKKHKEWSDDGVLVRKDNDLTLYNMEGDKLESEIFQGSRSLKLNDVFVACGKEIQLIHSISEEDFVSKKCFSKDYTPSIKEEVDHSQSKQEKPVYKSFKNVLTDQTEFAYNNAKKSALNDEVDLSCFEISLFRLPKLPENKCQFFEEPQDVMVDWELTKCLRDHQREGIEFMYKCIMGFYERIEGCILADEMGLGKTLQCIVLIYTLLKNGPYGKPIFKRVIILAPSSLVKNWEKEFDKWLKGKRVYVYAVDGKKKTVRDFLKKNPQVYPILIVSYDSYYRNQNMLSILNFDLLVCDEGHRLKNSKVKIFEAIEQISCKRRIILTGTPVQNNLKELYSLSNLVCPGILGTNEDFSQKYEEPIQEAQRKCDAADQSEENKIANLDNLNQVGRDIRAKLFEVLGQFILRREQTLFNYLPKKVENVIICKLTELQERIYNVLLNDKTLKRILAEENESSGISNSCLPYISFLRKLSNHPFLVNAEIVKKSYELKETSLINQLSADIKQLFDQVKKGALQKSGKFDTLARILEVIKHNEEKVVIVSHFTQTLDLIEQFCKVKNYKLSRLDGSTPVANRQKLVDEFNSERSKTFAFLLSSKAGGLGLNLVGASHIVLYDIDWNPAHDEQSKCRIYRDGQKKISNIYRLLTAGTIDEKMFQRQLDKHNLKSALGAVDANGLNFTRRDLKDIFSLNSTTLSSTHDSINCDCLLRKQQQQSNDEPADTQQDEHNETDDKAKEHEDHLNRSSQMEDRVEVKIENRTILSEEELDLAINQDESSSDSNYSSHIQPGQDYPDNESQKTSESQKASDQEEFIGDTTDTLLSDDFEVDLDYILTNDTKRDYDNDEESIDQLSNDSVEKDESESASLRVGLTKQKSRPLDDLSQWQHFSSPFDNSDMSSILFEARNTITFVFKNETGN